MKNENNFSYYLNNVQLKIVDSHRSKVCRYGQGASACRYLARNPKINIGYVCVKNTPFKPIVDKEVMNNPNWVARSDNCDGFTTNEENKQESESKGQG